MIYVVFPAWNEERVIAPTLQALADTVRAHGLDAHAVLVDDGSTDRTVAVAKATAAAAGLRLTVLSHDVNRGLGAGLRTGIHWCLDHAADDDVVVTLDADNTHPPALIPALLARLGNGYDLVIASRYREGSEVHGVPGHRRALSDVGRLVFQTLHPIPGVRDYTCCFRAYRVPLLRRARRAWGERLCTARGFEAVMDLLLRLRPLEVRASEVGFVLDYGERVGQSKMKVLRTIRTTIALMLRRLVERWTVDRPAAVRARADRAGDADAGRTRPEAAAAP
jgi:dolichol-phosphate mannosyltransferase